jgi:hypothetical protein
MIRERRILVPLAKKEAHAVVAERRFVGPILLMTSLIRRSRVALAAAIATTNDVRNLIVQKERTTIAERKGGRVIVAAVETNILVVLATIQSATLKEAQAP